MKRIKFILWLCLPLMLPSCLTTGEDTIILPPTEEVSAGIDVEAIPLSLQQELEVYMPIYEGSNPPVIEGAYLISPFKAVYASDNVFDPGDLAYDYKIRFTNQNTKNNTLLYNEMDMVEDSYASSDEVAIIGNGNDFTAYFISSGKSSGISYKAATLISGTWSGSGIKNLYYAFVMVDKGDDPNFILMGKDEFRVFTDGNGLAENSTWSKSAQINPSTKSLSSLLAFHTKK